MFAITQPIFTDTKPEIASSKPIFHPAHGAFLSYKVFLLTMLFSHFSMAYFHCYGNTAPQTPGGRVAVIGYGFLGCSGGILFFNLFLERIITLLAWALRAAHMRKMRQRGEDVDEDESLDGWKPSVYWVMLCLILASLTVALIAAAFYSPFEGWSFLDSIYFCFVSFATIGFGDFVSTQGPLYPHSQFYRLGNFIFLVLGCSCIYSLFNVTSIVIKQVLNWILARMDCQCCGRARDRAGRAIRRHSIRIQQKRLRRRSSAAIPRQFRKSQTSSVGGDSDSEGRRLSGEMISMKDLLSSNKVSLAVMQKQLYEAALLRSGGIYNSPELVPKGGFTPGNVGPLAILSKKLDSTDGR